MKRIVLLALLVLAGLAVVAHARTTATCGDYPNQAAAQRAHDTRDADGDGVYCESLPCPCAKPGTRPPPPALFRGPCRRGDRADRSCTPGTRFRATAEEVCRPGWASEHRHVSPALKRRVYLRYGIRRHAPYSYEVDHLVSLELGGDNSVRNLWPEPYAGSHGARAKDKLENRLHKAVCHGKMSLRTAQRKIARDWTR